MKLKTKAAAAAVLVALAVIASFLGPLLHANAATRATASIPAKCAYWTDNGGISAIAVTSGINCTNKSWTIGLPPYYGAHFENYNAFLSQVGELVHGPGKVPNVRMHKVGGADNAFTRRVPVTVYQGPGNNDGSSAGFNWLIHGTYPWGP